MRATTTSSPRSGTPTAAVCTLTYTALGLPRPPKERLEVFANGEAWIIDDFKTLTPGR